jgi:hypothetical protein
MPEYSHASSTAVRKYPIPFAAQTPQTRPVVLLGTTASYYTSVLSQQHVQLHAVGLGHRAAGPNPLRHRCRQCFLENPSHYRRTDDGQLVTLPELLPVGG